MAAIRGIAALTVFKVSFVQKFIYLFPLPLLVSDIECDGRTDGPTNTANLCVYIYIHTRTHTHTHTLVIFVCVFLVSLYEIPFCGKAGI